MVLVPLCVGQLYTFHFYYPCVNICANSTMWLTATLTIERFLFVRHPLWARAKCDRRSAKVRVPDDSLGHVWPTIR